MRMTLEQLKAMSDEQLELHWAGGQFPLEKLSCGMCLTEHGALPHRHEGRPCDAVKEAVLAMRHWEVRRPTGAELRPHLEELYALRIFYDQLYSEHKRIAAESPAPQPAEQQIEEALETVPGPISTLREERKASHVHHERAVKQLVPIPSTDASAK